jgi:hypothetical protein
MRPSPACRAELDGIVTNIELTLASIVQGLALQFLAQNAGDLLSRSRIFSWLYAVAALLIILLFWSRALIHTLTLIRWPLEFVHNFFYFGCALIEGLLFMKLNDPFMWFTLNAAFAGAVWALFIHDLRLIRMRMDDSLGPVGARLYAIVAAEQWLNIRFVMPAMVLYCGGAAFLIHRNPAFWIGRHWHLLLIAGQVLALLGYLIYVVRWFIRITPTISATRAEWVDDPANGQGGLAEDASAGQTSG